MNKSDRASGRLEVLSWVTMIPTLLISAPGLCLGVTGVLDWSGIISLRSGVDADVHFLAALVAPFVTVFALFPLALFVMGTRGHTTLKTTVVLSVVMALVFTYVINMNRMF
jgi:hypothetical protein